MKIYLKNRFFDGLLICIILFNSGCEKNKDLTSIDEELPVDPNYPTTLYALSESELIPLQTEFDNLNNHKLCSKLNDYGLVGNSHYHRAYNPVKTSLDSALKIAVNTVIKNSKFSNVTDSLSLIKNGYAISSIGTDSIKWKITFNPQHYLGLKIPFSWITVWVYGGEAYSMTGHWYKNIYIPENDNFSRETAKLKIIGEKIVWHDIAGKPRDFYIEEDSILEPIRKAVFPLNKEQTIELRVVWKIPIGFGGSPGWYIYLDTMSGEIEFIEQLFIT